MAIVHQFGKGLDAAFVGIQNHTQIYAGFCCCCAMLRIVLLPDIVGIFSLEKALLYRPFSLAQLSVISLSVSRHDEIVHALPGFDER